jgi:regulator of sigma E protease
LDTPVNPSPPDGPAPTTIPEETPRGGLIANVLPLIVPAMAAAAVVTYLDVLVVLKVAFGLGLVIFLHELGHFAAAKWCGVYVKTFSIGFGKPIPGLKFKKGETLYMVGWIPLGGYVEMMGEADTDDPEEAARDPRSLKNKTVGQRMLIVSAGVIMNILLAMGCFLAAYSHGIEEPAPIIGSASAGSPAWQEGLHSEMLIERVGSRRHASFADVRPAIMLSSPDEKLEIAVRTPEQPSSVNVPVQSFRDPEYDLFPTIGITASSQLKLVKARAAAPDPPVLPKTPAADAHKAEPLQFEETLVAMTDPKTGSITALPPDRFAPDSGRLDYFEYLRRLRELRGKDVTIRLKKADGTTHDVSLKPAYVRTAGIRFQMGRVSGLRKGATAAKARPIGSSAGEGLLARKADVHASGDKITAVFVKKSGGGTLLWSNDPKAEPPAGYASGEIERKPLDPLKLPSQLESWADASNGTGKVGLTVVRKLDDGTEPHLSFEADWDAAADRHVVSLLQPNAPMVIQGLGLAYQVGAQIEEVAAGSPADKAGLKAGDLVTDLRDKPADAEALKKAKWQPVKPHQAGYFFYAWMGDPRLMWRDIAEYEVKVQRGGQALDPVTLAPADDPSWPASERGLRLAEDSRLQKADGLGDAVTLGVNRTVRAVRMIYLNLFSLVAGRVSLKTTAGPITIANISYNVAQENVWTFIMFLGLISVNLAVVNFLPIPMLDGGHMVFLIYEKVRGKPAPENVQIIALWVGLIFVIALMLLTLGVDLWRFVF